MAERIQFFEKRIESTGGSRTPSYRSRIKSVTPRNVLLFDISPEKIDFVEKTEQAIQLPLTEEIDLIAGPLVNEGRCAEYKERLETLEEEIKKLLPIKDALFDEISSTLKNAKRLIMLIERDGEQEESLRELALAVLTLDGLYETVSSLPEEESSTLEGDSSVLDEPAPSVVRRIPRSATAPSVVASSAEKSLTMPENWQGCNDWSMKKVIKMLNTTAFRFKEAFPDGTPAPAHLQALVDIVLREHEALFEIDDDAFALRYTLFKQAFARFNFHFEKVLELSRDQE